MQRKEGQWSSNIEPDSIFSTYTCDFNFTCTYMFQKICYTVLVFFFNDTILLSNTLQANVASSYKTDTQIISTCFIITLIDFFFFNFHKMFETVNIMLLVFFKIYLVVVNAKHTVMKFILIIIHITYVITNVHVFNTLYLLQPS